MKGLKLVDRLTSERRSWLMGRVRGRDTKPEMTVRRAAHSLGLRFRLHRKDLPGTPDLVFKKHGVVVFVHGCYWHRHKGCRKSGLPNSNTEFWLKKFDQNVARDAKACEALINDGWSVHVIWECSVKTHDQAIRVLNDIFTAKTAR